MMAPAVSRPSDGTLLAAKPPQHSGRGESRVPSPESRINRPWRGIRSLLLTLLCLPSLALAQIDPSDLLPVDEAFALSARVEGDQIELTWQIADGYYLYRHAFRFEPITGGLELGPPDIPPGIPGHDEFFGDIESYRDRVTVRVPIMAAPANGRLDLTVHHQGCADLGVCYPPQRTPVSLEVSGEGLATTWEPIVRDPEGRRPDSLAESLRGMGADSLTFTGREPPLPAEDAFRFEAIAIDPATLLVRFAVHAGYYLYRDSLDFRIGHDRIEVVRSTLPSAEPVWDEYFGDTFVYYEEVEIPVHLARPAGPAETVPLIADFQGCQEDGICYPPMTRTLQVELLEAAAPVRQTAEDEIGSPAAAGDRALPVSEQDRLAGALSGSPAFALSLFFIAGILLAFTPCVFPMVPILSGLIAGEGDRMTTARAFRLSVVYVLAMALVYTAFGVIAALLGQNLQAAFQHPLVLGAFAALFVALALAMFGFYELQIPASWQARLNRLANRQESGTLLGAGVMGALSALVVGPCVAPALMGALIYIGQTGDAVLGGGALFAMAIGMGVPLVAWGTSAGKLLPRAGAWMAAVKAVFGVGLLALAVWMLERVVPPAATMLMWGALAIASGVYLGALSRFPPDVSGWRKLWQALGVMLLAVGVIQIIGAAAGGRDWTRPLAGIGGMGAPVETVRFTEIHNLEQLDRALAAASRPVFLDFYADWCVDCKRMERRTFTDAAVAERMNRFELLKIDVTAYDDDHREVLERFGLIGPPAYLFFDRGRELEPYRVFGFMTPARFAGHLDQVHRDTGR